MFARFGGYFGDPFKVHCGVTQGGLLSPTIFKVVVDAVPWHWFTVVAAMEETEDPST